jgi:hypothetical protein
MMGVAFFVMASLIMSSVVALLQRLRSEFDDHKLKLSSSFRYDKYIKVSWVSPAQRLD